MTVILPSNRPMPEQLTCIGEYVALVTDGAYQISERKPLMNAAQFSGLVRIVLGAAAAIFGTLGYMEGVSWEPVIGVLVTVGAAWWSVHTNKTTSMVAAVVESPTVDKVVMATPALAEATPALAESVKVVGPIPAPTYRNSRVEGSVDPLNPYQKRTRK